MLEKKLKIPNKMGLHARPAALFVQTANKFDSEVRLTKDGIEANGKSVMGLMMLAAEYGSEVILRVWGDDEERACAGIEALFKNKFTEE